jgi:SAM-dependent methyltransferase
VSAGGQGYAFDNADMEQVTRLRALESVLDPGSVRHLEIVGVQPGWRCLEAGAGGGSIADWMCDRVGPAGSVTAIDVDTTQLQHLSRPNLEVCAHDIMADDLPWDGFDLVHMRLLLAWLPDADQALQHMVGALRPGGILLAEEMDFGSVAPAGADATSLRGAVFQRVVSAHNAALSARHTFDPTYGRRVEDALAARGLASIATEGRAAIWRGGDAGGIVWRSTFLQLRESILATDMVTVEDIDLALTLCTDRSFSFLSQVTMAAWGTRIQDE